MQPPKPAHPLTPHVGDTVTFYVRHHNRLDNRIAKITKMHADGTADLLVEVTEGDIVAGSPSAEQTHVPRAGASPVSGSWKWSSHQARSRLRRPPDFDVTDTHSGEE